MHIIEQLRNALQTSFSVSAEQAAEESGVIVRRRKFTPGSLAQAFILAVLQNPTANSNQIAGFAATAGVSLSPQAVEQRYNSSLVAFFKALFGKMAAQVVASEKTLAPILERFSEVIVIDSSVIGLPDSQEPEFRGCGGSHGANKASLKLQTEFDLRSGRLRCVELEAGRSPDYSSERQKTLPPEGSLRIADLGYYSIPVLAMIASARAHFLSRIPHPSKIYAEGVERGLVPWLGELAKNRVDQWIELGAKHRLSCRLIAWRVPEEIANRRRQKLRSSCKGKTGREPTQAALAACDWEFMVTNLSLDQLGFEEAIVLYRARWQIELLFKRWKSHGKIDELDGRNDAVIMTRFWARLCASLIQHWLSIAATWSPTLTISLAKTAELVKQHATAIATAMTSAEQLTKQIEAFCSQAHAACRQNKRKRSPGTFQLLRNPEKLDYCLT